MTRKLEDLHEEAVYGRLPRLALVWPTMWLLEAYSGQRNHRMTVKWAAQVLRNFGFLLPADGADLHLRVHPDCRGGLPPPPGLWLLTRDAEGRPALVAPSATALPDGHPGQVRLVACCQALPAGEPALQVPADIIQWLDQRSGAVYVAR